MFINSEYRRGMSINVGDTFSFGSDQDGATIVRIEGDTLHVLWDSAQDRANVGWDSCSCKELIEIMEDVYGIR